jgi:hypothetical protein
VSETVTGLVVRWSGEVEHKVFRGLEDLQAGVGGYIESVRNNLGVTVYANEEGLLMGLPLNPTATVLCNTPIVGDVVLVGPVDAYGRDTNLPEGITLTLLGEA